jgi:hypothetical protein
MDAVPLGDAGAGDDLAVSRLAEENGSVQSLRRFRQAGPSQ